MFITFIYTAALFIVQKLEIFADLSQIDWYEEDIDLAISQFQRFFFKANSWYLNGVQMLPWIIARTPFFKEKKLFWTASLIFYGDRLLFLRKIT